MCEFWDEILLRGGKCKTLENLKFSKSKKKKKKKIAKMGQGSLENYLELG